MKNGSDKTHPGLNPKDRTPCDHISWHYVEQTPILLEGSLLKHREEFEESYGVAVHKERPALGHPLKRVAIEDPESLVSPEAYK